MSTRIVRDMQWLVDENDDLVGYRKNDSTQALIGTDARPEGAAAVMGAAVAVTNITRNADGTVSGYVWGGNTYAVTYDAAGFGIATITGGGQTVTVSYNAAGQITEITNA